MFSKVIMLLALPAVVAAQGPLVPSDTVPKRVIPRDTSLHPIPLQEAVNLAQQNYLPAIQAQGTIRSTASAVRSAYGEMLPNLNLSAGQTKSAGERLNNQTGVLNGYNGSWGYSTGLNAQLTVFDGFRARNDVRTQKANLEAANVNETSTQFNIALQVKTQYNLILAAEESQTAAYAQLDVAEQQFQTSVAKLTAGAANLSDSLRGVVAIGNAQLAVLQARNTIRTASAALTRLVGTPYFVTAVLADTAERSLPPIDSNVVVLAALRGPAVRAAEAQLNAQIASKKAAGAAYYPTVSLSLGVTGSGTHNAYGLSPSRTDTVGTGSNRTVGVSNPFPYSHTVGVSLSYPVFNRWTRENGIVVADVAVVNAEATLRDQRLGAQQNIVTQLAALHTAEEQIRLGQINVQASQEDLRVQQQRYALGAGTLLELLTTQNALVVARQQLITARLNYRNARAQIEAIIGQDLP